MPKFLADGQRINDRKRLAMFSWDNEDVKEMIDRYVKATYLPHLGVKAKPSETSAAEIAAIIKKRYGVNHSRHSVRHQFEKHRRNIASGVNIPTVGYKQRKLDSQKSSTKNVSPVQTPLNLVSPDQSSSPTPELAVNNHIEKQSNFRQNLEFLVNRSDNTYYIPRVEHFVPTGEYTYKINSKFLSHYNEENVDQSINKIDSADVLLYTPPSQFLG